MDADDDAENNKLYGFPNPFIFCTKLISLQAEIVSNCIVNLVSPLFSLISLFSYPFSSHKELDTEPASAPVPVPNAEGRFGGSLLGRIAMGLLAAAYVCLVLIVVLAVAAVLGVGLVRLWAEEPVYARESLQFDYADAHPTAVLAFAGGGKKGGVLIGHTLYVSLVLLMPESDYNRDVGIFQLTAELVSSEGDVIVRSRHPCMLQFRSWPIRLARTFLMGVPLLLGITTETQKITFPILKHKEAVYPRTEAIRIILVPRAGTSFLPQFYEAEVLIKSRPPWTKELVYRWKWTFYVWTTLHIFIMLVMVLVFHLRPLILPILATPSIKYEDSAVEVVPQESSTRAREEIEVSETLRRLQRSRSRRKAALLRGILPDSVDSSATSTTMIKGQSSVSFEEGSGDSESVCFGGFDG